MRTWVLAALAAVCTVAPSAASAAPTSALTVDVLSNRSDLISGGDALVAIDLPAGVGPSSVRVTDDGRDVTSAFARRADGRFEGLVTGLDLGRNVLVASAPGRRSGRAVVVN